MSRVCEGLAVILSSKAVFYNPAQVLNRDLSVACLQAWAASHSNLRVLEALSATGLRSIRYAREVPGVHVTANDIDPVAVQDIRNNLEHNGIGADRVSVSCADAVLLLQQSRNCFDVIDLDPFGTVAPFLDAAIAGIKDGGLLLVTCTDMRNLAAGDASACFANYGSVPLKTFFHGEQSIRIVLASANACAAKHKRTITPLLSLNMGFYVRLVLKVQHSVSEARIAASKVSRAIQCVQCGSFHLEPLALVKVSKTGGLLPQIAPCRWEGADLCLICGGELQVGGPMWNLKIHDRSFIEQVRAQVENPSNTNIFSHIPHLTALLQCVSEELEDVCLFWDLASICRAAKTTMPSNPAFKSALVRLGYSVSLTHTEPTGIKTDAPAHVIWDIMKKWIEQQKAAGRMSSTRPLGSVAKRVLDRELYQDISFEVLESQKKDTIPRFLPNPEKDWGPKSRPRQPKRMRE